MPFSSSKTNAAQIGLDLNSLRIDSKTGYVSLLDGIRLSLGIGSTEASKVLKKMTSEEPAIKDSIIQMRINDMGRPSPCSSSSVLAYILMSLNKGKGSDAIKRTAIDIMTRALSGDAELAQKILERNKNISDFERRFYTSKPPKSLTNGSSEPFEVPDSEQLIQEAEAQIKASKKAADNDDSEDDDYSYSEEEEYEEEEEEGDTESDSEDEEEEEEESPKPRRGRVQTRAPDDKHTRKRRRCPSCGGKSKHKKPKKQKGGCREDEWENDDNHHHHAPRPLFSF